MLITLGYMGSGKTYYGKLLSAKHRLKYADLDGFIERHENMTISNIFKLKGEIYFRKRENYYLKKIVSENNFDILSLGGGTPCYANNIDIIKKSAIKSVYLQVHTEILVDRLYRDKDNRPLIKNIKSKIELKEFIQKHLFEREYYYRQADYIFNASDSDDIKVLKILGNFL